MEAVRRREPDPRLRRRPRRARAHPRAPVPALRRLGPTGHARASASPSPASCAQGHGGDLTLSVTGEQGTVFELRLPARRRSRGRRTGAPRRAQRPRNRGNAETRKAGRTLRETAIPRQGKACGAKALRHALAAGIGAAAEAGAG